MAQLYNMIEGVQIADVSLSGPLFADGMGYPLLGIFGDYWQAVVGGVVGTSNSLSVQRDDRRDVDRARVRHRVFH